MSPPVLVIGPRGMLGRAWMELLARRDIPAIGVGRPELDLLDPRLVERTVRGPLRAVVNCAAYTDVDGAERDERAATELNGHAVGRLVARCDDIGVPLVHYSTDYVFDGEHHDGPYPVDHPTDPINAYGRSKRAGEEQVLASDGPHLLIRTSWLYAPWGKNFVRTIADLARERERLRVVDDQRGRPTSAEHLARLSLELLERAQHGLFHGTDSGDCTWFELARAIVTRRNSACRVEPCMSAEFPRPARRPAYSVLDLSKTEAVLGPLASWQDNLADVLRRLP